MDELIIDQNGVHLATDGTIVSYIKKRGKKSEIRLSDYRKYRLYKEKDGEVIGLEVMNEENDHDYVEMYNPDASAIEELCQKLEKNFGLKRLADIYSEESKSNKQNQQILRACILVLFIPIFWIVLNGLFEILSQISKNLKFSF